MHAERGTYLDAKDGDIEWELDVPDNPEKMRWFKSPLWASIIDDIDCRIDGWGGLFVEGIPSNRKDLSAVVLLPLEQQWITRHGPIEHDDSPLTMSSDDIGKTPASHRFFKLKEP